MIDASGDVVKDGAALENGLVNWYALMWMMLMGLLSFT